MGPPKSSKRVQYASALDPSAEPTGAREWRPVVSMELELPPPGRGADLCAARQVALAGASDDGVAAWPPSPPPTDVLAERRRRPRRRAGVGAAIRDRLIQEVRAHFADKAADVDGWLMNVTVHVETGGLRGAAGGWWRRQREREAPNRRHFLAA